MPTTTTTAPGRCPRHAKGKELSASRPIGRWVKFADLHREPFRL